MKRLTDLIIYHSIDTNLEQLRKILNKTTNPQRNSLPSQFIPVTCFEKIVRWKSNPHFLI